MNGGYNVVILAFWTYAGPLDMVLAWQGITDQVAVMKFAHDNGAVVLVSAGGSTEIPYLSSTGTAYGTAVGLFAALNLLDGVDFDLENVGQGLTYGSTSSDVIIQWMIDATNAAKAAMNAHGLQGIITHAPQAPYFGQIGSDAPNPWTLLSGGYTAVYAGCGNIIDWFNIQFYNQGDGCYTNYNSLFVNSNDGGNCPYFSGTSIMEIHAYGIPLSKLVVGKYNLASDAGNGMVAPTVLGDYFLMAFASFGWNAGVMVWCWQASTSPAWIAAAWIGIYFFCSFYNQAALNGQTNAPFAPASPTISIATHSPSTPSSIIPTTRPSRSPTAKTKAPVTHPAPVASHTAAPIVVACTAGDDVFTCSGCMLSECVPNYGYRVLIACAPGTVCFNGVCDFGTCAMNVSVSPAAAAVVVQNVLITDGQSENEDSLHFSSNANWTMFALIACMGVLVTIFLIGLVRVLRPLFVKTSSITDAVESVHVQ